MNTERHISEWLKLLRIHNPLTQVAAITAALVAGVPLLSLDMILIAGWAVLAHGVGFMHNCICDYKHDIHDQEKRHFPLVTGAISLKTAKQVFLAGFVIGLALAVWISNFNLLSITFLASGVCTGLLYNHKCKTSLWSPLWISIHYASLFPFIYFARAAEPSPIILTLFLFAFFQMLYSIGVEGYVKDLKSDKINLMLKLGMKADEGYFSSSTRASVVASAFRLPTIPIAVILLVQSNSGLAASLLMTGLLFISMLISTLLIRPGAFNHDKILIKCAAIEAFTFFAMVVAVQGVIGWTNTMFLLLYPLFWLALVSRVTWNTWFTPRV